LPAGHKSTLSNLTGTSTGPCRDKAIADATGRRA
jgi:hypothetical protein